MRVIVEHLFGIAVVGGDQHLAADRAQRVVQSLVQELEARESE